MSSPLATTDISGTQTIESLFSNFFVVPGYQRPYDWGSREVAALLTDLHKHAQDNPHLEVEDVPGYLLNSILTVDRGSHLEIIDGQQRITSLILLFAATRHHALAQKPPLLSDTWQRTLEVMLGEPDGDKYHARLTDQNPNGQTQTFINSLANYKLEEDPDRLSSAYALQRAYAQMRDWLRKIYPADDPSTGQSLKRLIQVVRKRVRVAEVRVSSEAVAWQAFERANDRGKPLSAADLVKSDLFNHADNDVERRAVADAWQEMLGALRAGSIASPDSFLRHLTLADVADRKISKSAVRKELKDYINNHTASIAAQTFRDAAKAYANIKAGKYPDGSGNCVPLIDLQRVRRFSRFAQSLPALLAARLLDHASFTRVAAQLERLVVIVTLTEERGQEHENDFFELATLIRNHLNRDEFNTEALCTEFKNRIDGLLVGERGEKFTHVLEKATMDGLGHDATKYLLWRVEGHLLELANPGTTRTEGATFAGPGTDVEHILPRSLAPSAVAEFGTIEDAAKFVESLGNLTLWEASPNSAVHNNPYSSKVSEYKSSRFKITKSLADGLGNVGGDLRVAKILPPAPEWTRSTLEKRHSAIGCLVAEIFLGRVPNTLRCKVTGDLEVQSEVPTFPATHHLVATLGGLNRGLRTPEDLIEALDEVHTLGVPRQALNVLSYLDLAYGENGRWELTTTGQLVCDETPDSWPFEIATRILDNPTLSHLEHKPLPANHPAFSKVQRIKNAIAWARKEVEGVSAQPDNTDAGTDQD